jgi:hypothetical protein
MVITMNLTERLVATFDPWYDDEDDEEHREDHDGG